MPYVDRIAGLIIGKYALAQYLDQEFVPDDSPELLPPPETPQAASKRLEAAVQVHLDSTAQAHGYDDIKSVVTYASEPAVVKYQNEGIAFRAWRSLVWAHCEQVQTDVEAGTRPLPTEAVLIAELPTLVMPT